MPRHVVGIDGAAVGVDAGAEKADESGFLPRRHERAWVKRGDWASIGKASVVGKDPERVHTALRTPDDLLVVSAGGLAGGFGAIIPPWLGAKSLAVTMRIEEKP